jgi:GT2 family glycosyltransferase
MDISIVILNTNDLKYLEECLESLRNCSKSRQVEIIVSDNASSDGSIEMMESRFPHVKILKNKENLGFTKGNNVGIKASQGRYVYLLNSDIKVLEGCIDILADYLDQHADVGLVGPKILNQDMTLQCSCRKDPTLWNNFCAATGLAALFPASPFLSGEQMFYFKGDRIADMDILVGCFSAIRRKAIDEVGLLDEGFYMYGDELDWCRRFRQAGWRVVYDPEARAIHYGGTSTTRKDPVRFNVMQQNSLLRYWEKYHGFAGRFGIKCLIIFRLGSRWAGAFAKYLASPGKRAESSARMRTCTACLLALFGRRPDLGSREPVPGNPAGNAVPGN